MWSPGNAPIVKIGNAEARPLEVGMGMTEQVLGLSSKERTVLDRLGDAEETIRQVLKDADEGAETAPRT
jgi:hypothetical protein